MKRNAVRLGWGMLVTAATLLGTTIASVEAAPVKVEVVVSPKEQMRLDFADGSKRYLVMVKREGKATGNGPLVGATVVDWGMHDVMPGIGAEAHGYLVFTMPEGDIAYIKSQFRAVSVPGSDGKPKNLLNGFWEVVSGTGKLKGLQGAGTLRINVVSPTDRQWILEGELVQASEESRK